MPLPQNVGEVDHNVRMFLGVPAFVITVGSAMAYHAYVVSLVSAVVGAAIFATGALRYSPLYHVLNVHTRFGDAAVND